MGDFSLLTFYFTVRSRDFFMAEAGEEEWEWELAPGDHRRGGPLHDEMAQGRGGEELARPHSRERQEQQPTETGGGRREEQPY